ncbi:hypothetical protein DAPPUDRAFT_104063 [Daphnia pulex]|uniref:Uncharacterized protein n=1 Tax=Daphnia pulex TaxID=6669 RepID=E9GL58_DAPPU|nr:hypothetical protein DAPPUDRAFT_104063 [Daphnia pulex]|eukprot:EFX79848.1 hypothetical protein DAPPUDRAFT_104063 [Daphnia pulex]
MGPGFIYAQGGWGVFYSSIGPDDKESESMKQQDVAIRSGGCHSCEYSTCLANKRGSAKVSLLRGMLNWPCSCQELLNGKGLTSCGQPPASGLHAGLSGSSQGEVTRRCQQQAEEQKYETSQGGGCAGSEVVVSQAITRVLHGNFQSLEWQG